MAKQIGVDVGGTFTDVVVYDDASRLVSVSKVPTDPTQPEAGVVAGLHTALTDEQIAQCDRFVHGNTVGLNALLTRTGAVVGLLCTAGFRDILEIRRGDRADPYDLFWRPPPSLVPRWLRCGVRERLRADGVVDVPLTAEDVTAALERFREAGVTAVAVAFLNAYVSGEHELAAEELLRAAGFDGQISLSHRISGEYREYERTSTTVIDAFVRGRMGGYVDRLSSELRGLGVDGSLMMTRSGGGALTFDEVSRRPFEAIMSGPVAGAQGGAALARQLGIDAVVTADVGGTSFDTCLIRDGELPLLFEGSILGMPLQTDWVDVRSIGAGGGSIAHVDAGGLLRAGPASAGSVPGPACYRRGGEQPTVTDAAALLGMLGEGRLAGGLTLDVDAARAAFAPLAGELDMTVEQAARGSLRIAAAAMANAIREITIEQGEDPRGMTLMPFGGAGPLFGVLLARELEMERIVVPLHAGNFSAWGLLSSDHVRTLARTRLLSLGEDAVAAVDESLRGLLADLDAESDGGAAQYEASLDMRYRGQEHSLTIDAACVDRRLVESAEQLRARFEQRYVATFDHLLEAEVEIVAVRATRRVDFETLRVTGVSVPEQDEDRQETTEAYSFDQDRVLPFRNVARAELAVGERLAGPVIVTEPTATTYLDHGFVAELHPSAALIVTRAGDPS